MHLMMGQVVGKHWTRTFLNQLHCIEWSNWFANEFNRLSYFTNTFSITTTFYPLNNWFFEFFQSYNHFASRLRHWYLQYRGSISRSRWKIITKVDGMKGKIRRATKKKKKKLLKGCASCHQPTQHSTFLFIPFPQSKHPATKPRIWCEFNLNFFTWTLI